MLVVGAAAVNKNIFTFICEYIMFIYKNTIWVTVTTPAFLTKTGPQMPQISYSEKALMGAYTI